MPIFSRFGADFFHGLRRFFTVCKGHKRWKKNISLLMIFFTVSFSRFAPSWTSGKKNMHYIFGIFRPLKIDHVCDSFRPHSKRLYCRTPEKWFGGKFSAEWFGFRPESQRYRPKVGVTDQKSEIQPRIRTESPRKGPRMGFRCFCRKPPLKPSWIHLMYAIISACMVAGMSCVIRMLAENYALRHVRRTSYTWMGNFEIWRAPDAPSKRITAKGTIKTYFFDLLSWGGPAFDLFNEVKRVRFDGAFCSDTFWWCIRRPPRNDHVCNAMERFVVLLRMLPDGKKIRETKQIPKTKTNDQLCPWTSGDFVYYCLSQNYHWINSGKGRVK